MTSAAAWFTSHCRASSISPSGSSVRTVIVWVKLRCTFPRFRTLRDVGLLELRHAGDVGRRHGAGLHCRLGLGWDTEHRTHLLDRTVGERAVVDIEEIGGVSVADGAAPTDRVGDPVLHPGRLHVTVPDVAHEE